MITPNKTQELILYLLQRFDKDFGSIELSKLLYLIDVESIRIFGDTLTKEKYIRKEKGPMISHLLSYTDKMNGYEIEKIKDESLGLTSFPKIHHKLGKNPRFRPSFSDVEIALIGRVLEKTSGLSPLQLERIAYSTEPMKKILKLEEIAGHKLIGCDVDLSTISKNEYFEKWREFNKSYQEPNTKYDEHLESEKKFFELLVS